MTIAADSLKTAFAAAARQAGVALPLGTVGLPWLCRRALAAITIHMASGATSQSRSPA